MMLVYQDVLSHVDTIAQSYISANVAVVAAAITPAVVSLLSLYVILWGIASLRGQIQEPITDAAARILKIALVLGIALQLGHYSALIIDTFFSSPERLARMLTGAADQATTVTSLDSIVDRGFKAGSAFWEKGGLISGDFGMYFVALIVWGVTIAVTAYACFLIVLAKIALTLVIALGPLFIVSLLFQPTANFFNAWIQQLSNYGILIILVVGANIFMLTLFEEASTGAAAMTSTVQVDQIFPFVIIGVISLFVLHQLPTIASGLAGGLSLSSGGAGHMGLAVLSSSARKITGRVVRRSRRDTERKAPREPAPGFAAYENRDNNNR